MSHRIAFLLAIAAVAVAGDAVPGATAEQWLADPEAAAKAAGAVAKKTAEYGAGFWAAVGGAALTALAGLRMATPILARLVPGWGPLVEGVANLAWNICATRDQKAADKAAATAKDAASYLVEIAANVRKLPPGTLPDHVQQLAASPIVTAAIEHLSTTPERPAP